MLYLHKFNSQTEYNNKRDNDYLEPWVSATNLGEDYYRVDYNKPNPLNIPLTFEITSDGVIRWDVTRPSYARTIQYSKNGGEWTSITSASGTAAPSISVVAGDEVQFRGDNAVYDNNRFLGTTCGFTVKGNIMSLINSTDFASLTTLTGDYAFATLFTRCTGLTDSSELMLPATTLTTGCYTNMFYGCSGLTAAPELPATTLADYCYQNMFFYCSGLTIAPELPATTLGTYCYDGMFYRCSNLNYIKCLATDISANFCTHDWVYGVASTGTFVKNPAMSSWKKGTSGIPTNWTVQDA